MKPPQALSFTSCGRRPTFNGNQRQPHYQPHYQPIPYPRRQRYTFLKSIQENDEEYSEDEAAAANISGSSENGTSISSSIVGDIKRDSMSSIVSTTLSATSLSSSSTTTQGKDGSKRKNLWFLLSESPGNKERLRKTSESSKVSEKWNRWQKLPARLWLASPSVI